MTRIACVFNTLSHSSKTYISTADRRNAISEASDYVIDDQDAILQLSAEQQATRIFSHRDPLHVYGSPSARPQEKRTARRKAITKPSDRVVKHHDLVHLMRTKQELTRVVPHRKSFQLNDSSLEAPQERVARRNAITELPTARTILVATSA